MHDRTTPSSNTRDDSSGANRLTVDRPIRDADRNRDLVDRGDPETGGQLFPSLETGITLLDVEDGRGVPVLQSLVVDHLLTHDGPAFWVDADGHATTTTLARITPSRRLLDRIHVARGFTAAQHYGAVGALSEAVNQHIRQSTTGRSRRSRTATATDRSSQTPALLVAPAVDARYRGADAFDGAHAETLQARTLARLRRYAEAYDAPVLVTRSTDDAFTEPVATAADRRLACEQTRLGPRLVGEDFETLVYPVDDGAYYQTTLAYWRQLLAARAERAGLEPAASLSPGNCPGSDGATVGAGVTADGESTTLTASPLADAWSGAGAGGR